MNVRRLPVALFTLVLTAVPALARMDVTLDAGTLNELLVNLAPDKVDVDLPTGRSLTLQMKDMKVTGFDPTDGPHGGILTSVRLVVPDLGIDTPVTPKLTLDVKDSGGQKSCYLRFGKVMLNLPIAGAVDVAALIPPLELLPESGWKVNSARGPVLVKPQLLEAKTGAKSIRVGFDLDLQPAAAR